MTYTLNLFDDARDDIQLLAAYLDDKFDRSISDKVLSGLFDQLENLRSFTKVGKPIETLGTNTGLTGFYYLRTPKNTILYDVNDAESVINILRIFDNRQDVVIRMMKYLVNYKPK
ncbi:type II toxin-antitoxin system RelE/ParE family toxin [Lentilactobacillus parafarraginis]|uniref:type II toxin-antitoxin system RelE/ParE family toxin n=1 Tax=Lentilactobacillus parafarraginis TaxID=390842 RepID=UPI0006D2B805|nr:type II toxin-antitoxin system RelE/ParE family toxin [Lentilactobacillus parafarraginis]